MESVDRRRFAVQASDGEVDGIELTYLDPDDPDDRHLLILAEHPELAEAMEDGIEEVEIEGQVVSPSMHITLHEMVANQLWDDDPPETWSTAERLVGLGYERHEVLHMLASVASDSIWRAMHEQEPFDLERFVGELNELPGSWERLRPP